MYYKSFKGKSLSELGFGAMRLPCLQDGCVDEAQVFRMVDYAIAHGINYFDTAYPYHNGYSEIVIGKALSRYPRESYHLATKYPGHQIASSYNPASIFEEQLQKCGVEYFDFYLLHNVYENSFPVYTDPKWGIIDYFVEQKKAGRIRHLGFSSHALPDTLEAFLERYGDVMEFCQIQLNYLDWTLQDAKSKCELLNCYSIPIWVMEPLRGGKLASLNPDTMMKLTALRPEANAPSWAFNFLRTVPGVTMILSGMSSYEQMVDNVNTFDSTAPLCAEESAVLLDLAEGMKNSVPCTACRYCTAGCPMHLDIPKLLSLYNDVLFTPSFNVGMTIDSMEETSRPDACIGCGKCARTCPQKIDIPSCMKDFAKRLESIPHWKDLCIAREEAARKLRESRLD